MLDLSETLSITAFSNPTNASNHYINSYTNRVISYKNHIVFFQLMIPAHVDINWTSSIANSVVQRLWRDQILAICLSLPRRDFLTIFQAAAPYKPCRVGGGLCV